MEPLTTLLTHIRVLPILTVDSAEQAVATVKALHDGGTQAVEITLRTPAALAAISAVKAALPNVKVGAGTIKTPADIEAVHAAGADFAVSPGLTRELAQTASEVGLPFLPGVATPSDILKGIALGFTCFKLFPAEAIGGIPLLKSLAAPFPEISFCPTGGINPSNFHNYLALPNVICVGGSWMVKPNFI